jgi:radical SAM protein with 4Fe4S-binding SPASM domain
MTALAESVVDRCVAKNIPLSVHVDLTMRCNERCRHCYRMVEDRAELTTAEIEDLLDQLARAGALYLTFSGGEIFLRRDLFGLVEHAKRLRFDVRLKTNALLVTDEAAARLRRLGVRQVDVSVYSADPAVHDAVTQVPGSLARSLQGVARLRDAGLRVKLNCPLMTVNVGGYRDVRALAERLGVPCGFDPMITARNDGDRAPLQLRVRGKALLPILDDPSLTARRPAASGDAGAARADLDEIPCSAGHNACYVSAYGDVMPCVAMPIACGNVREAPFADIWFGSARMRQVRAIRIRDLHTCAGCSASRFCSRCPGQAFVEDGDLYGPSSAWCGHALTAAQAAGDPAVPASMLSR